VAIASSAHADIYQWEYINPADPSQGKQQSTTLAPDGAGVDAVPGADLSLRDLSMAYLAGADFTNSSEAATYLINAHPSHPIAKIFFHISWALGRTKLYLALGAGLSIAAPVSRSRVAIQFTVIEIGEKR
jgi:hypothetical protein